MAIQNDNTLVTKGDLKALYSDKIAPYLGTNLAIRTSVSDYYSEDEKVIGIWTDGKPVYQKTFITTFPTLTTSGEVKKDILIGSSIDTFIQIYGCFNYYSTNNIIMIPFTSDTGIIYLFGRPNTSSSSPKNCICLSVNPKTTDMASKLSENPTIITAQYTKTTDAASTALTAGCYDINFPNTWPENTEIYFGNGLYGYRYVPNDTISCPNARQTETYPLTDLPLTTRLRNIGGCLAIDEDNILEFPWCYHDPTTTTNNSQHGGFYLSKNNNKYRLTFYEANGTGSAQTLRNIDVWVTYTK